MERQPDRSIDLRGTPCPINWVKTKLQLEAMQAGQLLEVLLDDGDPIRNVPRSIKDEGHKILEAAPVDDGYRLLVERAGAAA